MINKFVVLNVFCSKKPCQIIIMYNGGKCVRKYKISSNKSKICIYTKAFSIKIIASYKEKIYYKTVYLNGHRCQNIFLNFGFNTAVYQKVVSIIKLTDAKYGFPITNAVLNFRQKLIT